MAFTMCVGFSSCGSEENDSKTADIQNKSSVEEITETTIKETEKATTEPATENQELIVFYNSLKKEYSNLDKFLSASENQLTYSMPTEETMSSFTQEELLASVEIGQKFMDFLGEHETELIIDTKQGVSYNTIIARKK